MTNTKMMTVALIVVIAALSYQTVVLAQLSAHMDDAQIGLGVSNTAVNFSSDGGAPQMVGGC